MKNFVLWGKMPSIWQISKDFLLLLLLLNILITSLEAFQPETISFVREEIAKPAEAATPKEEPIETIEPKKETKTGNFSAYNSEPGQTDSDPYTMANGKKVHDGAIANNCLPFGANISINGKTYTVEDRMNRRFGCDHFDIWMEHKTDALHFGRKQLEYEEK